jgi:hypothetical protein
MNKLYGMLVDSPDSGELYYRNTDQEMGATPASYILIPQASEKAYKQYCADQLCGICHEVFPQEIAALDPQNSYKYPASSVVSPETLIVGVPAGIMVNVFDLQVGYPFVERVMSFSYDGVSTLTFQGVQYPWNDGTGVFDYQGLRIAFTGIASGSFSGTITATRSPSRSLIQLDEDIMAYTEPLWDPAYEPYRDSTLITQRIAAFTLNTLKKVLNG